MKFLATGVLLVFFGGFGLTSAEAIDKFDFEGELLESGSPAPWEVRKVAGTPKFNVVPIAEKGGEKHLYLHSEKSSFSLNRRTDVRLQDGTRVSWSWKGEKLPFGKAADANVIKVFRFCWRLTMERVSSVMSGTRMRRLAENQPPRVLESTF
jgi:hypothetical protein